jgi:gliding motility-associated-like protein
MMGAKKQTFISNCIKSKNVSVLFLFLCVFFLNIAQVKSHTVQLAYCVSCTGDLRLYVEHWHTTADPATTTMTIQITIDGVMKKDTASPAGRLLNVTYDDLPNCATNSVSFASCARANSENYWVIYDFPGAVAGSVVDITVISGSTEFTFDCDDTMYPASTGNFIIPTIVEPDALADITLCGGIATGDIVLGQNENINWVNDNTGIGLAATGSGAGIISSFVPTIVTTLQVANIAVEDGCFLDTFQINILPAPDPITVITSASSAGTFCVYDSINILGDYSTMLAPETITSYAWDFGDGTTSTNIDNKHIYATAGTYDVNLTLTGSNGCINSTTTPITAFPKPIAAFSTNTACAGMATNFNGGSSTVAAPSFIANQLWEYGDGSQSVGIDPSYSYSSAGTYSAQLIALTDQGCRDTTTNSVSMLVSPVAAAAINNSCVYDSLTFSSGGSSIASPGTIESYTWDFGDGQNSSIDNPKHIYAAAGTYNVTVTATSAEGCPNQFATTVTAHPVPSALFTFADVCRYEAMSFDASTSTISSGSTTTYDWKFGDGRTGTSVNPINLYALDGTYDTELIVTSDNNCKDTITQPVTILPVPVAAFTFNEPCLGIVTNFSSTTTTISATGTLANYSWTFDDGNTSTIPNPSNLYLTAGDFAVRLSVTSTDGCVNEIINTVKVHPKPVAAFTFTDRCTYDTFAFDGSTSSVSNGGTVANYAWDFGDGNTGNGASTSKLYDTDNTYTVELITTSDNNCLDTIQAIATAFPIPMAEFSFANQCLNTPISFYAGNSTVNDPDSITNYTWDFAGTIESSAGTIREFTFATADTFLVQLTVSTSRNCTHDTTVLAIVYPLPTPSFIFGNVCEETPLSYTNTSTIPLGTITDYFWDFGNTQTSSLSDPALTYNIAGTYDIALTAYSANRCKNTTTLPVIVKPKPTANFGNSSPESCSPLCINFTDSSTSNGTSITKYSWSFSDGNTSLSQNLNSCFINDDNEVDNVFDLEPKLVVTNDFGCMDSLEQSLLVSVYHNPLSSFDVVPSETDMHNAKIQFENYSLGTDIYKWIFADGNSSDLFEPLHLYNDTGTYIVKLYNETVNGCLDSSENPVRINPVIHFTIPNAFTPNGDGINDVFNWDGYGIVTTNYEFYIFNRWGELIFKTNEFKAWDGCVNSHQAQEDVYVYKVYYQDVFEKNHKITGIVTLIR